MSNYIIPVEDFKKFLDENKNFIPHYTSGKLSIFAADYFVNDVNEEKQEDNELIRDTKKHFKTFMDADYVDSWMEHNKTFLDKLNEIKDKNGNFFDKIKESEPIFNEIRENSKSFFEKYTKKKTDSKPTRIRDFKCYDMISENGNKIVYWWLITKDGEYEGFGSKGVAIAKKLQEDGILEAGELAHIKNIHNFCKEYGKNS